MTFLAVKAGRGQDPEKEHTVAADPKDLRYLWRLEWRMRYSGHSSFVSLHRLRVLKGICFLTPRAMYKQVVACFVGTMGKEPTQQINNIVFFDRSGLKDFLYGENVMKEGFLQRFVAPATIPFDNTATNVTLHVSWSQYKCLIEQVSGCPDLSLIHI